jgi:hypothetical protein
MNRLLPAFLATCLLLPTAARPQSDDAAYCAKLADLYRHHIGDMGIGSVSPDVTAANAMEQCRTGNTAAGIAVLEAKLRANGFSLPKRN